MNHDAFVNFLAREAKKVTLNHDVVEIETEAHYNHYGNRGAADLVKLKGNQYRKEESKVFEAKTHLEKAHKTIRQFKKMMRFFYKDEDRTRPEKVTYELTVLPTRHNFKHLREYQELYDSVAGTEVAGFKSKSIVTFRGPTSYTPIPIFAEDLYEIGCDSWWETATAHNAEAASRIRGDTN